MKKIISVMLLPLFLSLTGCYTPQVMQAKSQNIHRIALAAATGEKTGLYATIQPSFVVPANSLMGGLEAVGLKKSKTFNDLALEKFPKGVVYDDFNEEMKRGLAAKGFQVVDVTKRVATVTISYEKLDKVEISIPLVSAEEADVVLVPVTNFGYFATSVLAFYHRQSFGQFAVIDTKTQKVIFAELTSYQAPDSQFEYASYEKLTDDIVPAVEALRDVAKVAARNIVKSLN